MLSFLSLIVCVRSNLFDAFVIILAASGLATRKQRSSLCSKFVTFDRPGSQQAGHQEAAFIHVALLVARVFQVDVVVCVCVCARETVITYLVLLVACVRP